MTALDLDPTPQIEGDDPEWLAWRLAGITATDVAQAFTGSYGGSYSVVARKLGKLTVEQNDAMRRGHRWEQPIADAVPILCGLHVVGEQTWCENTETPWHRATIDGFLAPETEATIDDIVAVLETKTNGLNVNANWELWNAQVQWQMHCTGMNQALIARAVIDDDDDRMVSLGFSRIDRDEALIAMLRSVADDLWAHVQAGTLPPPDTASALDDVKVLATIAAPAGQVDISDLAEEVARFDRIKESARVHAAERDEIEARIRAAIGDHKVGTTGQHIVTISAPAKVLTKEAEAEMLDTYPDLGKVVLDRQKAKADPAMYEAYRQPVGARRISIKAAS